MTSIVGVLACHAQYLSTTSRSRGQDVNLNGVKRSRSRLRSGQAVKQEKRWSKFFDPGRSCDYGVNRSDHPLSEGDSILIKEAPSRAGPVNNCRPA